MPTSTCGDTRRHVLLPFKADPCEIGPLRGLVAVQLAAWGALAIADAVTLAVSELATNVVCHVGESTPAALYLEYAGDRLLVELHDTSRSLPTREAPASDEETGRGLALVAAVSGGWIATPTPGGKAVCCEFTIGSSDDRRRWSYRIARGSSLIDAYGFNMHDRTDYHAAADAMAVDLVTGLLHWLSANGRDPDAVLAQAQMHFATEVTTTKVSSHGHF